MAGDVMTSFTILHVIEASLGITPEPSSLRFVEDDFGGQFLHDGRPVLVGVTLGDVS
jgi:hypothetical protein